MPYHATELNLESLAQMGSNKAAEGLEKLGISRNEITSFKMI